MQKNRRLSIIANGSDGHFPRTVNIPVSEVMCLNEADAPQLGFTRWRIFVTDGDTRFDLVTVDDGVLEHVFAV